VEISPNGGGPGPATFTAPCRRRFFVLSGNGESCTTATTGSTGTRNDFLFVSTWRPSTAFANEADAPTSILMLFAPGAPREHYFEGMAQLGEMSDEERRDWFIKNDNFFIE